MRGCFFEVSKDPKILKEMEESMFYDSSEGEWFEDQKGGKREEALEALFKTLKNAGFETGVEEYMEETIPYVVFHEKGKLEFFKMKYEKFQAMANSMSLHAFATNSTAVTILQYDLRDTYGDAVFCDGELHPIDDFVRDAEGRYYFGNVVTAH